MSRPLRGALQVALSATLWGLWSLFLRWGGLDGLTSAAILMTILALSGIPAQWRHRARRRPPSAWGFMLLFGVFDAGNTGFFFLAIAGGTVGVATLCHYLAPVLTPPIAFLLLGERLSRRTYPAAVAGLLGLALLLQPAAGAVGAAGATRTALLGAASAVFYATMVPLGKKLAPLFSPLEVQSYHSYVSAAILWLVAPHVLPPAAAAGKVALGGLVCGVVAGLFFYRGIRSVASAQAAVLTYLEPLVATAVGAVAFHEQLGPWAFAGALLVVGGGAYLMIERPPASPEGGASSGAPVADLVA
jgi:drug/metabolite transporter (DMT)-like permease